MKTFVNQKTDRFCFKVNSKVFLGFFFVLFYGFCWVFLCWFFFYVSF